MRCRQSLTLGLVALLIGVVSPTRADVVTDWNRVLLDAVRAHRLTPPEATRAMAMTQVAVYDAVVNLEGGFEPYHVRSGALAGASSQAAAAAAAHRALTALFPDQTAAFDGALTLSLAAVPPGRHRDDGIAWGRHVADEILALRANDGASQGASATFPEGAGWWEGSPPGHGEPLLPQWPGVRPWTMTHGTRFRPQAPPAMIGDAYLTAWDEVYRLGRSDSVERTAEETEIAWFWVDGPGTVTPPGHWHEIAQTLSADRGLDLVDNARLFALLGIAGADAAIVAWDSKYWYCHWRPHTAILAAEIDGNPATLADPGWEPLIPTPPFPSYLSGHSTFSATSARILSLALGTDALTFSTTSDALPGVVRVFDSLWEAAEEAGQSRVLGGIHWQYDNQEGLAAGRALAEHVFFSSLRPFGSTEPCVSGATRLCLNRGRFAVEVLYAHRDLAREARAVPLTDDSGAFWFFSQDNLEVTLKVLDGCAVGGRFWVFASGLTDVEVTVAVTDTATGATRTYFSPAGAPMQTVTDTAAFVCR